MCVLITLLSGSLKKGSMANTRPTTGNLKTFDCSTNILIKLENNFSLSLIKEPYET